MKNRITINYNVTHNRHAGRLHLYNAVFKPVRGCRKYTKQRPGYHGDIKVEITLDEKGTILAVNIGSHKETPGIGTIPVENYRLPLYLHNLLMLM